jgi:hypothetical protein
MKRPALLLTTPNTQTQYRVHCQLQKGEIAEFRYSNRQTARDHFELLRYQGHIGNLAIREITFHDDLNQ